MRFLVVVAVTLLISFGLVPFTHIDPRQAAIVGLVVGVVLGFYDRWFVK